MNVSKVDKLVIRIEKAIGIELNKGNYDNVLALVSVCAQILYRTNIKYKDSYLEEVLEKVSRVGLFDNEFDKADDEVLLFWDGFGLNDRGLIQIYLKSLCKIKKVVYVTYSDRQNEIPDVLNILKDYKAVCCFIERNDCPKSEMIKRLNQIVKEYIPGHFFFYSTPDDVVAVPLLYAYEGTLKRYQINLTDHAFWLGAGCCDVCINFRDYGAKISYEYRGIDKERNVVIPFYPIIHYEKAFQGFPFEVKNGDKVVFSGGELYKTLGENNKYYEIVDHILSRHQNIIFWYAGRGNDTELKKILQKYPNRSFHTDERSDLFQVLEHCDMYLSTYPMCGGLMFQYAAMAGIVPVTLKHGNISDDFLINQKNIKVEFDDVNELYNEVDNLLCDQDYSVERSKLMKKSVIDADSFENEVQQLVLGERKGFSLIQFEHIDTESFRHWYLEKINEHDLDEMVVKKEMFVMAMRYYPYRVFRSVVYHRLGKLGFTGNK